MTSIIERLGAAAATAEEESGKASAHLRADDTSLSLHYAAAQAHATLALVAELRAARLSYSLYQEDRRDESGVLR